MESGRISAGSPLRCFQKKIETGGLFCKKVPPCPLKKLYPKIRSSLYAEITHRLDLFYSIKVLPSSPQANSRGTGRGFLQKASPRLSLFKLLSHSAMLRNFLRYAVGVMSTVFLKLFVRLDRPLKPVASAISATGMSVVRSSCFAWEIRMELM